MAEQEIWCWCNKCQRDTLHLASGSGCHTFCEEHETRRRKPLI